MIPTCAQIAYGEYWELQQYKRDLRHYLDNSCSCHKCAEYNNYYIVTTLLSMVVERLKFKWGLTVEELICD